MIIPHSQLEKALGRAEGKFLLACLSSGFEPTIVYAAGTQMQLVNLYRAMGANRGHCLGACTTGAAALEHLSRVKPGILLMCDDLLDTTLDSLVKQAKKLKPAIRTIAIISRIDQFFKDSKMPVIVADQDLLVHAETVTLMMMAVATNTTYHSPSILRRLNELNQKTSVDVEGTNLLTRRERQLLEAYALGLSNQETAKQLCLSPRTVQTYSSELLQKLGANNRQKALRQAMVLGFKALGRLA
jgi:DNA-binding NarL/FixJ family response regulator